MQSAQSVLRQSVYPDTAESVLVDAIRAVGVEAKVGVRFFNRCIRDAIRAVGVEAKLRIDPGSDICPTERKSVKEALS